MLARHLSFALLIAACVLVPFRREHAAQGSRIDVGLVPSPDPAIPVTRISYADGYGLLFEPRDGRTVDLSRWLVQVAGVIVLGLWLNGATFSLPAKRST